ncbi:hypothetical protein ACFL3S_01530 [Gemmatimonadota bacterium]
MFGCLKSCLGRVVSLLILLLALFVGWKWGPVFAPVVKEWLGIETSSSAQGPEPSPELADSVLLHLQAFSRGEGGARMALGNRELTSVLRYSLQTLLPEGVSEPSARMQGERILLRSKVQLASFPDLPDLGPILGLLPDTLDVALEGSLMALGDEEGVLLVRGVEASRIPLPRRMIPQILRALGRESRPGLPPEAFVFPLPGVLTSAYILSDSLILTIEP